MVDSILLIFGALFSFLSLLICFKHIFSKNIYFYIIPTVLSSVLLALNIKLLYEVSYSSFKNYIFYIVLFSFLFYISNLIQHHALKIKIKKNKSRRAMEQKEKETLHIQMIEEARYKKETQTKRIEACNGFSKPRLFNEEIN